MKKEIEQYEKLPRADASSHPPEWWKVHFKQFLVLSLQAKQCLCVSLCVCLCVSYLCVEPGG